MWLLKRNLNEVYFWTRLVFLCPKIVQDIFSGIPKRLDEGKANGNLCFFVLK